MNQFVILSFGVDPLNWPSFIEIGVIARSTPAWCTHGLTLKKSKFSCYVFSSWKFRVYMRCSRATQSEIIEFFNQRTTM